VSAVATKPRLGFLGVGWIGRNRLEAIERSGRAEIVAVSDPALAASGNLAEHELDGVVIASPSALHAEQSIAALERGCAVFCQKPLARNASEATRVVDAARVADKLVGVDLSYREVTAFAVARDVVRSGELGEIVGAQLAFHNAYGPDKSWFYDPVLSGGGCLIDLGIHLVDFARWTLGPLTVDDARVHGTPVETFASARLGVVSLACSWRLHAGRDAAVEATFWGTEGGVSVQNVDGSFYDFRCERFDGTARTTLVAGPDDWMGRAAMRWVERLAAGERYDETEAAELVALHETIDELYGRAQRTS
jgi:predicted dehydrogenase